MSKAFGARFSAAFVGEGPGALTAWQRLLPEADGARYGVAGAERTGDADVQAEAQDVPGPRGMALPGLVDDRLARSASPHIRVRRILKGPGRTEDAMIILGVILLVIGLVAGISILWTIGIVLVAIGLVLWILGAVGHAVGGRRHYW
ncbi:hypothetical protein GCM10009647_082320 [Streptomyces sanglieri]